MKHKISWRNAGEIPPGFLQEILQLIMEKNEECTVLVNIWHLDGYKLDWPGLVLKAVCIFSIVKFYDQLMFIQIFVACINYTDMTLPGWQHLGRGTGSCKSSLRPLVMLLLNSSKAVLLVWLLPVWPKRDHFYIIIAETI